MNSSSSVAPTGVKGSKDDANVSSYKLTDSVILNYVAKQLSEGKLAPVPGSGCANAQPSPGSTCVDVKTQAAGPSTSSLQPATLARQSTLTKLMTKQGSDSKAGVKLPVLKLKLPLSFAFANTATNVDQTVLPIDVTATTEWSSLSALYDEYRFLGVDGEAYQAVSTVIPGGGNVSDAMRVVAYDPEDGVALSSVRNGCEMVNRHKLYAFPNTSGAGGSIMDGKPVKFSFRVKPMESFAFNGTGLTLSVPGTWKSMTSPGAFVWDGYLKTYNNNTGANSASTFGGILWYICEFRSRK